jgi:hypothetical protein
MLSTGDVMLVGAVRTPDDEENGNEADDTKENENGVEQHGWSS